MTESEALEILRAQGHAVGSPDRSAGTVTIWIHGTGRSIDVKLGRDLVYLAEGKITPEELEPEHAQRCELPEVLAMDRPRHPQVVQTWKVERLNSSSFRRRSKANSSTGDQSAQEAEATLGLGSNSVVAGQKGTRLDSKDVVYRLDSEDRITYVNEEWGRFAAENGAPELEASNVIGRSIWAFVTGKETQQLYRVAFGRVRSHRRVVSIPFRCDSPGMRRYMSLQAVPLDDWAVEVVSRIERVVKRDSMSLLELPTRTTERRLQICSFCKRVHLGHKKWAEVEGAVAELDLVGSKSQLNLNHVVCEQCRLAVQAA
jgi:hypothetical protein